MKIVKILLFTFLCCANLLAQPFIFKNYGVEDGIAQSQVYSTFQDRRGILWFGTQGGGLTAFDGITFKTYTEREGLLNNTINHIKEDEKGNLWIATKTGLSYYDGIQFKSFQLPNKQAILVSHFDFDTDGNLWIASNEGLYLFDGKNFKSLFKELKLPVQIVNKVLCTDDESIYFGGENGLYLLQKEQNNFQLTEFGKQNRIYQNAIASLKKDRKGILWFGTFGDGLYGLKGKNIFRIDNQNELQQTTILDIYVDKNDEMWIATLNKGVFHYNKQNSGFQQITEIHGLSSKHVRSIIQDNNGNYWFGTSGGGVCNYLGRQFTHLNVSNGLSGKLVYTIFRAQDNSHWLGTNKGLTRIRDGQITNYNSNNGFIDVQVKSIAQNQNGNLIFGTEGKGLYLLKNETIEQIPLIKTAYIRGLVCDKNNNFWVATAGLGLYRLTISDGGFEIKQFTVEQGLLSNRLTSLILDKNGDLWYATERYGLACIDLEGKTKFRFNTNKGLISNEVISLTEDEKGNIWFGTLGAGITCIQRNKHNQLVNFSYDHGLSSSIAYLLCFDQNGSLWIGSEKGLDRVDFGPDFSVRKVKHFTKGDGFIGVETCRNAVFKDKDGTIWFGSINGVSRYYPSQNKSNSNPPILRLTDIKLFYESLSKTEFKHVIGAWKNVQKLDLPYDQNHLTFEFFGVNLSNPEAVRYKWKLEGFDENWSPESSEKSIVYSNLNPGKYRFLVKACNEDEFWSTEPYTISFSIAKPFWRKWWFILLIISTIILSVYTFFRRRENRIKNEAAEMQQKLQLEKELVELEQRALRLQMNPHFIFNAMNSIQSQIGIGKDKEARYYLAKFSRLMRQILDHSRTATISLEAELNTLENYLLIEQFCNGNKFDYIIQVPENLDADFIQVPPMILQPFVENAIKHGFRQIETTGRRGKITITFDQKDNYLECIVLDNGIGRKQAAILTNHSNESNHKSLALSITVERLQLMGELSAGKRVSIEDLEENGISLGTKVVVRIPWI